MEALPELPEALAVVARPVRRRWAVQQAEEEVRWAPVLQRLVAWSAWEPMEWEPWAGLEEPLAAESASRVREAVW